MTAFAVDKQLVLAEIQKCRQLLSASAFPERPTFDETMHAVKMVATYSHCEVGSPQKQTIPYPLLHVALAVSR